MMDENEASPDGIKEKDLEQIDMDDDLVDVPKLQPLSKKILVLGEAAYEENQQLINELAALKNH